MSNYLTLLLLLPLLATAPPATAPPAATADTRELLRAADFFRGGHVPGIAWDLTVTNYEGDKVRNEIGIDLQAATREEHLYSLARFREPRKYDGQQLLVRDNNMWFMKPGLRAPIPISNRQRLSGSAANADIASPNYYYDYAVAAAEEATHRGRACLKLELTATNRLVSYPRLVYWIDRDTRHGLHTEYYGKSGKLLKTADFRYDNEVTYGGKGHRFISEVVIRDAVKTDERTVLTLARIRFPELDPRIFQKASLLD